MHLWGLENFLKISHHSCSETVHVGRIIVPSRVTSINDFMSESSEKRLKSHFLPANQNQRDWVHEHFFGSSDLVFALVYSKIELNFLNTGMDADWFHTLIGDSLRGILSSPPLLETVNCILGEALNFRQFFQQLVSSVLGPGMAFVTSVTMLIFLIGAMISYLIITGTLQIDETDSASSLAMTLLIIMDCSTVLRWISKLWHCLSGQSMIVDWYMLFNAGE